MASERIKKPSEQPYQITEWETGDIIEANLMRNIEDWLASANDELMEARSGSDTLKDRLDLMWDRIQRQFDTFNPILESGIIEEINALYDDLEDAIIRTDEATSAANTAAEAASTVAQGKVDKTGDTMTGPLIIKNSLPFLALKNNNNNQVGSFKFEDNKTSIQINSLNNPSLYESYYFSDVTTNNNPSYEILTTKNVLTVEQGGTGGINPAQARENLGAVNIAGDTMTGDLSIKMNHINFTDANDQIKAFITCRADQDKWGQFVIQEKIQNSSYHENYNLPIPNSTRNQNYDILTTKNPVTLEQGGTGVSVSSNEGLLEQLGINQAIANAIIGGGAQLTIENNILQVESGGTGASTEEGARTNLGITPANIGALPNTGGTLTGILDISVSNPRIRLNDNTGATKAVFWFSNNRIEFLATARNWTLSDRKYATFYLPRINNIDINENQNYEYKIWTTKEYLDPLPIAKGGTGIQASSAEDILTAIHGLKASDFTATSTNSVKVAIEHGGTNATTPAEARTNLGITPANIGALATAGGTVTGNLIVQQDITIERLNNVSPVLSFKDSTGFLSSILFHRTNKQLSIRQYGNNRSNFEYYTLPAVTENITNNIPYKIWTDKELSIPISITQGGTGATTPEQAIVNLHGALTQNLTATTDLNGVTTSGMYYFPSQQDADAREAQHIPSGAVSGLLFVTANENGSYVKQIFSRMGGLGSVDSLTYIRTCYGNNGWGDWYKIYTDNTSSIALKNQVVEISTVASTPNNRIYAPYIRSYNPDNTNTNGKEVYFLPVPSTSISSQTFYDIITTNNVSNSRSLLGLTIIEQTVTVGPTELDSGKVTATYTPTIANYTCIGAWYKVNSDGSVIIISQPMVTSTGKNVYARIYNPTTSTITLNGTMHFIFISTSTIESAV